MKIKGTLCGTVSAMCWLAPLAAAEAQIELGRDASYFCVEEFSGGLRYNENLKKWGAASFRADGKFVLKLKFIRSRESHDFFGERAEYEVSITEAGTSGPTPCVKFYGDRTVTIYQRPSTLGCEALGSSYRFGFESNRFLKAYLEGYWNGSNNNDNTPNVAGGTCTKID